MPTHPFTFAGADGQQLVGTLSLPADEQPIGCALFAHCFTCSKDIRAARHIAEALTRAGLAVLRFDFTGLGESEGEFADTHFTSSVEDLIAAAEAMEAVAESPRLLIGHSLGGAAAICAAPQIASVRAVATIGAPCDPEHVVHLFEESLDEIEAKGEATVSIGGRPFRVRDTFVKDVMDARVTETLRRLGRALLVLHAPQDQVVGVEHARALFEHARHPKSFVSLDTADHLLSKPADSRYAGAVIAAWAARYIGPSQPEVKHRPPDDNYVVARIGARGFRTDVVASGYGLVADEPTEVGGSGLGPTPYDYLLAGLGACTAMTLRMYADRKQWPLDGVTVRLHHQKVHAADCDDCPDRPATIDHIERQLAIDGDLDEAQRQRLVEIANRCPVHRTLERTIVVETELAPAATPPATP